MIDSANRCVAKDHSARMKTATVTNKRLYRGGTIYKPENAILQIFIKAHRDEPYKKIISEIINQK